MGTFAFLYCGQIVKNFILQRAGLQGSTEMRTNKSGADEFTQTKPKRVHPRALKQMYIYSLKLIMISFFPQMTDGVMSRTTYQRMAVIKGYVAGL